MSSFHGLSQYSQVSLFPRRPKLPCTLTFDERLRCRVTRQALQHITPSSRPPKIILYKFRCCLFITSPSPRASLSSCVLRPTSHVSESPSPESRVPRPRVPVLLSRSTFSHSRFCQLTPNFCCLHLSYCFCLMYFIAVNANELLQRLKGRRQNSILAIAVRIREAVYLTCVKL